MKQIVPVIVVILVILAIIMWQIFYWTSCAFVPAGQAPGICFA